MARVSGASAVRLRRSMSFSLATRALLPAPPVGPATPASPLAVAVLTGPTGCFWSPPHPTAAANVTAADTHTALKIVLRFIVLPRPRPYTGNALAAQPPSSQFKLSRQLPRNAGNFRTLDAATAAKARFFFATSLLRSRRSKHELKRRNYCDRREALVKRLQSARQPAQPTLSGSRLCL